MKSHDVLVAIVQEEHRTELLRIRRKRRRGKHPWDQCFHLYGTVELLYNGQVGVGGFVRYKEVSFIGRLVQECICNPYKVLLSCHEVYMIHVHS